MLKILEKVTAFITRQGLIGPDGAPAAGDLLLIQHPQAGNLLPDGSVEAGESPEQAVLRWVSKETGLDAFLPDREGQRSMSVGVRLVGLIGVIDEDSPEGAAGGGVRRYLFHLTMDGHRGKQRAAAPERWSIYVEDHLVKLFWAPLGNLPVLANPHDTNLDYALRELGASLQG